VLVFALVLASTALPAPRAGLLTQHECGGAVSVSTWHFVAGHVLENLLFAEGSLWISDSTGGEVVRLDRRGRTIATVTGPTGGLAQGPDGRIYAGVGNSIAAALLDTGASSVVSFDPDDPARTEVVARGFSMANGMTFGPDGTLYTSNDVNEGLVAIDVATGSWRLLNDLWGANGLVVSPEGATLYAAITFDQRSPIARIPLTRPGAHDLVAHTTFGLLDLSPALHLDGDVSKPIVVKGLDDMTRDAAGTLYPVANGLGELLRVDPDTGAACVITGKPIAASSVRIAPEDGAFADGDPATLDFYVTEFTGRIVRVIWRPPPGLR
jgi:sugar lactone lactonase YvrE